MVANPFGGHGVITEGHKPSELAMAKLEAVEMPRLHGLDEQPIGAIQLGKKGSTALAPTTVRGSRFASRIIVFVILLAALAAVRVPFLANVLIGEEGGFAFLVANPAPSHALTENRTPQHLIGNIDGKPLFADFEHAITPYYILEMGLGTLTRSFHILELDFENRTRAVRTSFALLFMIGVAGLLYLSARTLTETCGGIWSAVITTIPIYVLSTPLALGASIQPQIDGSVGVLLLGLAGYLLVCDGPNGVYRFGFAGLLVGIGRTEWVLAFLLVIATTAALGALFRVSTLRAIVPIIVGLAVGITFSVFLSSDEYIKSFKIMVRVADISNAVPLAKGYAKRELIYTAPLVLLLLLGTLLTIPRLKTLLATGLGILISLGAGGAIFLGFTLSGHPAQSCWRLSLLQRDRDRGGFSRVYSRD
jgi:hypothetical protein